MARFSSPLRAQFESNRRRIIASQSVCAICGQPIDKTLKYPDPMSPVVDHIIPVAKGGSPNDISNMQLAHAWCNRQKSDKLAPSIESAGAKKQEEYLLPLSRDWTLYKPGKGSVEVGPEINPA